MSKFYTELKKVLIDNRVKNGHGYFETIKQHGDMIAELISEYERYDMYIGYNSDDSEGYTEGSLHIGFKDSTNTNYTYYIQLLEDARYWGYCQCSSEDEGYDPVRNCCGSGCDWTAPRISVSKTIRLAYGTFVGEERDMWKLESEWQEKVEASKDDEVAAQVAWFDEQIAEIQKRKEMYMQEQTQL